MKLGYWCFILVLVITGFSYAAVIRVPDDQPTIQAGIDAAVDGDTVLVANGTYTGSGNKNLDFKGKAITVTSEGGAESCIIDCESDSSGFYFHSGETEESVVSGFTITHGKGIHCENFSSPTIEANIIKENPNGGIYCSNSSPIIQDNEIIDNHNHTYEGGGIFCIGSSPTIQNNKISENFAVRGGGVYCEDSSSPMIINNTISENLASSGAGGIEFMNSSPTIENNEISGNHGGGIKCGGGGSSSIAIIDNIINGNYGGSGINCSGGDVSGTIQDNEINSNTTTEYGGGICSEGTNSLTIQNNIIINNEADYGAGIYCSSTSSAAIIQNNEISLNEAKTNGGGICCRIDASPTIINNIISDNFADGDGGGICCWENSSPTIISNVINKNLANSDGGGIGCYDNSSPMIQNNEISLNSALYGGGIYCYSSSPTIINNTVSGNSSIGGGGILCWYHSYPKVTNTILWSDFPYEIFIDTSSEIDITYSDIQGGWEGEGNIDADPLFIDPDGGDFHLSDYSLCIGAGIMTPDVPDTDIDGNPRPNPPGSNPDMGAYEHFRDVPLAVPGDVSGNGKVTAYDASLVLRYVVGLTNFSEEQRQAADVTGDDTVTALDAALILQYTVGLITKFLAQGAPILTAYDESQLLIKIIAELEDFPLSPEQRHVLEQLQLLLWQQALPKHTALLQNYPNPFNPETWIPFKLAHDVPVTISIYNTKGQLVRTIALGTRTAGIYTTKDRAAYWNGRNSIGQKVSSGVYYYTLQAGEFRATRKMVVVK